MGLLENSQGTGRGRGAIVGFAPEDCMARCSTDPVTKLRRLLLIVAQNGFMIPRIGLLFRGDKTMKKNLLRLFLGSAALLLPVMAAAQATYGLKETEPRVGTNIRAEDVRSTIPFDKKYDEM